MQAGATDRDAGGRQALLWLVVALAAVALLFVVLRWGGRQAAPRWSSLPRGDAERGARLYQDKGCVRCHDSGRGGAPALARASSAPGGADRLVAAMWNHAPQMWESARSQELAYPELNHEDLAHLAAYLALRPGEPGSEAPQGAAATPAGEHR